MCNSNFAACKSKGTSRETSRGNRYPSSLQNNEKLIFCFLVDTAVSFVILIFVSSAKMLLRKEDNIEEPKLSGN